MPFSPKQKMNLMFKAGRRCCICWEFCLINMEVDHIIQEADGGPNEEDNGIPVCFKCHAGIKHYNPRHPKGNMFRAEELKRHRDRLFEWIEKHGPVVFDAQSRSFLRLPDAPVEPGEPPKLEPLDLDKEAKVSRFFRYLRKADELAQSWGASETKPSSEAERLYESALALAQTTDLSAFEEAGHVYNARRSLWRVRLELAANGDREALRRAVAMGFDKDSLRERRPRGFGGLAAWDYFGLLRQEHLQILDGQEPMSERLMRYRNLMDILDTPHSGAGELRDRALKMEGELRGKLPPNTTYERS